MAADDLRDCRVLFKGLKLNISLIYSGVRDLEILNINLIRILIGTTVVRIASVIAAATPLCMVTAIPRATAS